MKKYIILVIILLVAIIGISIPIQIKRNAAIATCTGSGRVWNATTLQCDPAPVVRITRAKDATYVINGIVVSLNNGFAETVSASGSISRVTTRYFGNEATGDVNGDGSVDTAFLLTQEQGGSGTFYYVAAALQTDKGYIGTNAVLLGDRIAPQTTEIKNDTIIVNYADRKLGEAFTVRPSMGVSKYFTVRNGALIEVQNAVGILHRPWKWIHTTMKNGTKIVPKKVDAFTLTFKDDGTVSGTTDCNSFGGTYVLNDATISFGPFASTEMFCEGSQESVFIKEVSEVQRYSIGTDGSLLLHIKIDAGTMFLQ